jgi:hypothetical protein
VPTREERRVRRHLLCVCVLGFERVRGGGVLSERSAIGTVGSIDPMATGHQHV